MARRKDHVAREQRMRTLSRGEKWALAVILFGVVVFAVSMALMGADLFGVRSTRARMAIEFEAWVTLQRRPVPSVTALLGIAISVWGVFVANRATRAKKAAFDIGL